MEEKISMFKLNLQINNNVIECADLYSVKKTILCLSTCVFPDFNKEGTDWQEVMLHSGPPNSTNEGYAYAKRMMEVYARLHNEKNASLKRDVEFLCVIPTNIYGPYDNFNLDQGHVIPSLIHKCYLAKRDGTTFKVKGNGVALRQFIHAKDVANKIIQVLFKLKLLDIPNGLILAPTVEYTIRDVVEMIANEFDLCKDDIWYDHGYSNGQHRKTADTSLLQKTLGADDLILLKDGIKETVKWFIHNYNDARK